MCKHCVYSVNKDTGVLVESNGVPACIATTTDLKNCFAGYNDNSTLKCKICNSGYEIDS